MRKNVFVLNIGNYRPDLTRFTLPTIAAYAARIGAALKVISHREYSAWPITYEKMQVYHRGRGDSWNILCDADIMLHPDTPDFTETLDPGVVGFSYGHDMRGHFEPNPYFARCGHTQAIAAGFVVTSWLTHDLWKPLKMSVSDALAQTKREWIIDEFALTYNLAKYGLRFSGVLAPEKVDRYIVHLGSEQRSADQRLADAARAEKLARDWGF